MKETAKERVCLWGWGGSVIDKKFWKVINKLPKKFRKFNRKLYVNEFQEDLLSLEIIDLNHTHIHIHSHTQHTHTTIRTYTLTYFLFDKLSRASRLNHEKTPTNRHTKHLFGNRNEKWIKGVWMQKQNLSWVRWFGGSDECVRKWKRGVLSIYGNPRSQRWVCHTHAPVGGNMWWKINTKTNISMSEERMLLE